MALEEINPHHLFAVGEGVRRMIKVTIAVDRYAHERTPAIELALVLYEFDEGVGGRDGDVGLLMVRVWFGGCDPASLIGFKREIPRLIEGNCDVVVDGRGLSCGGRDERGRSSEGKQSRVRGSTSNSGKRTSRQVSSLCIAILLVASDLDLLLLFVDSAVVDTVIVWSWGLHCL